MCIVFSSWCIDIFISKSILLNFKVVGDFLIPFIFVCLALLTCGMLSRENAIAKVLFER